MTPGNNIPSLFFSNYPLCFDKFEMHTYTHLKMAPKTKEHLRLEESKNKQKKWQKWGPYLSERQWGTVREDYSENGDAWNYFTHAQSRSRAYRWGEDGIAGISDSNQHLCFSVALWNEKDSILKERLFGLTNSDGNHGEDVKEYYFYLDNTPTHSYMKYLYKYPHNAFPYKDLRENNRNRNRLENEYELLDTNIFEDNAYFDILVEYAKNSPDDISIKINAINRGNIEAPIHLLPTLWFRNTWAWEEGQYLPVLKSIPSNKEQVIYAKHTDKEISDNLGEFYLYLDNEAPLLFTNNETNNALLFNGENKSQWLKDGINNYVVNRKKDAINPKATGTKVSPHYQLKLKPGEEKSFYLRLSNIAPKAIGDPFKKKEDIFKRNIEDADAFYKSIEPSTKDEEILMIYRQAMSGMLWTKQYFEYDVSKWLKDHGVTPWTSINKGNIRNREWYHMLCNDILSMPDKWEYPWFAVWDSAFHMLPMQKLDPNFTKKQLKLLLSAEYQHPNGQMPAYEWNFGDVNPPVHAWVVVETYLMERKENNGKGDKEFLKYCFGKLLLNFNWWVNRKDPEGNNLFHGGFLGLDNIGVFDRSSKLPTGGHIEQADGTAWMAFFSMQMLRIAFELAKDDKLFKSYVYKFFMHSMWISGAMDRIGESDDHLWDQEDGFFYDLLHFPDGSSTRLKIRSMVGLLPLMSVCIVPEELLTSFPKLTKRLRTFIQRFPEIIMNTHKPQEKGLHNRRMISIIDDNKLRLLLTRMLDENEFLSPYGIRSLSKFHQENPYIFHWNNDEFKVEYLPGESDSSMFGGNSNWRGPVWIPVNILLINSLLNYYCFYGNHFKMECPIDSGNKMNLLEIAQFVSKRIIRIFTNDENGSRPCFGDTEKFQSDKNWKDNILFYEYFHAETGKGLGASHQTGWTGCITSLMHLVYNVNEGNFNKDLHLVGNVAL